MFLNHDNPIMHFRLTIRIYVIVAVFASVLANPGKLVAQETLSDIADMYEAQATLLQSFYVKYRTKSELNGTPEDAVKYLGVIMLRDDIEEYAFKGNKRYYSIRHVVDDSRTSVTRRSLKDGSEISIPANRTVAFNGSRLITRNSGGQSATIGFGSANRDDLGFFDQTFMGLIYRTLPNVLDPSDVRADNRMDGAIRGGKARLLPDMEEIEGVKCVVVEVNASVRMRFWCDPNRGYAVIRQEGYYPDSPAVRWRSTSRDFIEVASNTWFPKSSTNLQYAGPDALDPATTDPVIKYHLRVIEMRANSVDDELFDLVIPPGTIVSDIDASERAERGESIVTSFHMPANGRTLDETISDIRENRNRIAKKDRRAVIFLAVFTVIIVGICVVIIQRKAR